MTFTAGQIVASIEAMNGEVQAAQDHAKECFNLFAQLSNRKERAWNVAYAGTSGTIPVREQATIKEIGELYYLWRDAKLKHEHALRMLKSKEAQLSAVQSQAGAMKSEMELALRFGKETRP